MTTMAGFVAMALVLLYSAMSSGDTISAIKSIHSRQEHAIRRERRFLHQKNSPKTSVVHEMQRHDGELKTTDLGQRNQERDINEEGEVRSRVILAPIWSVTLQEFRQMNINSDTLRPYPLPDPALLASVAYVSTQRKLLLGLMQPEKILSSFLDSNETNQLKTNILTYGMAVDEGRGLVFMSTEKPYKTISRMTTLGDDFTVISRIVERGLTGFATAIAVNPREMLIYSCNEESVFMVSYDGTVFERLVGGSQIYALTLDSTGNNLFYNNGEDLWKMSLSGDEIDMVTSLGKLSWTFQFYQNKLYYSTLLSNPARLGVIRFENDDLFNVTSQPFEISGHTFMGLHAFAICLV